MKTKNYLWRTMCGLCMAAAVGMAVTACSGDDDEPGVPPSDKPGEEEVEEGPTGDVSFTLDADDGTVGNGTAAAPFIVAGGTDGLTLSLRQESRYTDPDSTVIIREPVATVGVQVKADTIVAHDLKALLTVGTTPEPEQATEGNNPRRETTRQTFTVGGQEVTFSLSHEIYSIVNSLSQTVEMPYLRLHQAAFGSSEASEETRSAVSVSAISVRPLTQTRSVTVTDSTRYEVDVRFSVSADGVHTEDPTSAPLNFSVTYIGIVETVTEYDDPVADLTYTWSQNGATLTPPLEWNAVSQPTATLTLNQTATYTNMFGTVHTANPVAQVVLTAQADTIWAQSAEDLQQPGTLVALSAEATGESPVENAATYAYTLNDSQTLTFGLHWQSRCTAEDADTHEPLNMPNVRFGELSVKSVMVQELETKEVETLTRYNTLYNVTTTFSLELISEGIGEEKREEVDLVVTTLAATEVKLVKVTYKRDWEWVEPHDNMALFYYAKVHRTRHYSNDESFTDTFMDGGHTANMGWSMGDHGEAPVKGECGEVYFQQGRLEEENIADSIIKFKRTNIITAPQEAKLSVKLYSSREYWGDDISVGMWSLYGTFGRFYDNQTMVLGDDVVIEGDIGTSIPDDLLDRRSGWYVANFGYMGVKSADLYLEHDGELYFSICISYSALCDKRYDQYLLLDGRMFTFIDKDIRPDPQFDFKIEDIPGGWQITHEMRLQYMGRNFYMGFTDVSYLNP